MTVESGNIASKFLADVFGPSTVSPVYISSLPNDDAREREPPERQVATRELPVIDRFLKKWDRPDRGLYFCTATVRTGQNCRSKETLAELNGLFLDIDFEDILPPPEEVERRLGQVMLLPSYVVHSGHGLHCYWLFKEALPATTPENIERFERLLRLLADHLGGDLQCAEASRLLRLPGSHNTKHGQWVPVRLIVERPLRYEIDDLEDWLSVASPVIARKQPPDETINGHELNPWLAVAARFGAKPPVDVEARLAAMRYGGAGDASIHQTQISVSAALLNRGQPIEEVIEIVLAATRAAAGSFGERWNWRREERALRGMCESWIAKHPEIRERTTADERKNTGDTKSDAKASGTILLHWHGEIDPAASRAWLVADLLPETGKGLVSGQWGTYKTFAVLDLAGAVMAGGTFINFSVVRRGGVLFIAAEGATEIPIRLQAMLEAKYPQIERAPFAWTEMCPRLLDRNAVNALVAIAQEAADRMQTEFNLPLVLIIIDTLIAGAGFIKQGDENDAAAGQAIMNVLERVSQQIRCLVLGVDHFGKSAETGTRGTSAKEGSADIVLALLGNKSISGEVTNTRLATRKRRGGPSGEEFAFSVRSVDMGIDQYGAQMTSLVIDWRSQSEEKAQTEENDSGRWSKSLRLLRQVLMNVLVDHGSEQRPFPDGPVVRAVDIEIVRGEFYRSYPAEGDTEKKKQTTRRQGFHRAVTDAQGRGLVAIRTIEEKTFIWLASARDEAMPSANGEKRGKTPESD